MANLVRKFYYGDDTWTAPAGVTEVKVSTLPIVNQTFVTGGASSATSAGMYAIDINCDAYAWGVNTCGALGNGSVTVACLPTLICCGLKWRTIGGSTSSLSSAGVTVSGDGYSWGNNSCGKLGNGSTNPVCLPTLICCGLKWKQITGATGDGSYMLGLAISGDGYSWGNNTCGALGNGSINVACLPTLICCGLKWRQLGGLDSIAGNSSFGITTTCDMYGWGSNLCGQLGNGSRTVTCLPTLVCCGFKWRSFATGGGHVLAINSNCDLYAWGTGQCGGLGNNSTSPACLPTLVCCGLKWRQVSAGLCSSVGITFNGDMYAWGSNACGRLGIGSISATCQPVLVCCGLKWRYVSMIGISTFGITFEGDMYSWGSNACGVLGNGSITEKCLPTLVCCAKTWLPLIDSKTKQFSVVPGTAYPIKVFAKFTGFAGESIGDDIATEGILLEYLA